MFSRNNTGNNLIRERPAAIRLSSTGRRGNLVLLANKVALNFPIADIVAPGIPQASPNIF
jgi:hypothetical protein